ncbi:MAG TPA: tetratricopeptide repeat protein, partial [Acidobacteriota bacterium]|nr:tetratricopeptide repeat protein [Acidobacteriota bacterium]
MRSALLALSLVVFLLATIQAAPPKSPAAASGDAAPQLVAKGPKWKNVEELRRFAAQGDAQACFELGDRLLNGDGVATDPRAAREWLDRAARGGVAEAMFRLGKLHNDGVGGPKNLELALDYYGQAALHGVPEAQHNIGAILVSGRGVKRDYAEGLAWLIVAEKNGAASDAVARTRTHLAKRPADIAAAEKRAAELLAA